MGNHDAGQAMVRTATALAEQRCKTGQSAMEILDIACRDFRGCDAEFDDAMYDEGHFRSLLIEAFGPYDPAVDDDGDIFYETIQKPFSARYGLT